MGWLKKTVKKAVKAVKKAVKNNTVGAIVGAVTGVGAIAGIAGSIALNNATSSSNTSSGTTTAVIHDTNVYIPAMDITFEGNLFKPNTRLYVFFDGRDVSSYIQPDGQATGTALMTDNLGKIKGVFHLPNNDNIKFVEGKKELKFTDSSKNDNTETTYSSAYFTYSGSDDKSDSQDAGGFQSANTGADPLVQTFLVLDRGGIYLRAVDLYFVAKDNKYPILFQIREVSDDTVSEQYLTNSNYILTPGMINVSSTGTVATTVKLHSPVFLQEGKEYAIYLVTNAPASYYMATCVYGETNSANQLSTKDPRIGGMMKNLGSQAWLKDTSKGIKFVLHKCAFDTTRKYTLALDNEDLPTTFLANNSLSTTISTNSITVTDPDHGFNPNDFVTITGLPADTDYAGINSNYINGVHRIDSVTHKSYSFSSVLVGDTETTIPTNANASIIFGTNITTDTSYQYDILLLNNAEILLSNTNLNSSFVGLSGQSLDGNETPNIFDSNFIEITNKVDYNTAKVKKINSPYNEAHLNPNGKKSLQLNVDFSTNNENISPIIDIANTNAMLVENVINNKSGGELTDTNLEGIARYITNDIQLSSQSNGIQVRFSGNIMGSANVKVYYKILPITSTGDLSTENWVEMELDTEVPKATNNTTFNDYKYTVYNLPLFKAFKTKVLMTSPDSTKPPLIQSYRAIAFQSVDNE